jgi:hypothetical protein
MRRVETMLSWASGQPNRITAHIAVLRYSAPKAKYSQRRPLMPDAARPSFFVTLFLIASCVGTLTAQHAPNSNAVYQQLREPLPGSEVITVKNLEIKRDAAVFTFKSGSFTFYLPINGKVTGAVFHGSGHLHITPPTAEERHNLSIVEHV